MCFAGGVLYTASHVWANLWFLALVAFMPFFIGVFRRRSGAAALCGFWTALPLGLLVTVIVIQGESRPLKSLVMLGFVVALVGTWALLGAVLAVIGRSGGTTALTVSPIAVWGVEVFRELAAAHVPIFGPFFSVGLSQVYPGNPLYQAADILGVAGLSAVVVLVNLTLSQVLWDRRLNRPAVTWAVVTTLIVFYGLVRPSFVERGDTLRVAVVGSKTPYGQDFSFREYQEILGELERATIEAAGEGARLIAWPEQSLPFSVSTFDPARERLKALADAAGVPLIVGGRHVSHGPDGAWDNENATYLVLPGSGIVEIHDKQYWAPLEATSFLGPGARFRKSWGLLGRGAGRGMAVKSGSVCFASAICYEGELGGPVREAVLEGSQFLVVASNDAGIGVGRGLYFSFRLHQGRSVENRRWLCRTSNGGFNGFVSSTGYPVDLGLPVGTGVRVQDVGLGTGITVYTRFGYAFELAAMTVAAFAVLVWPLLALVRVIRRKPGGRYVNQE